MEGSLIKGTMFVLLALVLVGTVTAQEAVFNVIPGVEETIEWEAGKTYRVDVTLDNIELEGTPNEIQTVSAQWDLIVPAELSQYVTVVDAQVPEPGVDFFSGSDMFFEFITKSLTSQVRMADSGQGKTDSTGSVGSYLFKVHRNAPNMNDLTFDLDRAGLLDENGDDQPFRIEYTPFNVKSSLGTHGFWDKLIPVKIERIGG